MIGKKKFDLRMYVLVTSYKPLKVWVNKLGFARFSNEEYKFDPRELDDLYIHLTNVAIQKYSVPTPH
jgi:tubulin polyglutamylase TTLL1